MYTVNLKKLERNMRRRAEKQARQARQSNALEKIIPPAHAPADQKQAFGSAIIGAITKQMLRRGRGRGA